MERRVFNAVKQPLLCTALLLTMSSCTDPMPRLAACPAGLQPIPPLPAPKLPVGESIPFTGTARVRFVIDQAGRVHSPVIVSHALHSSGRNHGGVTGYREAIIAVAAQFRYPAQATPCRMDTPFSIELEGGGEDSHVEAADNA